jgi:hypothetical protein
MRLKHKHADKKLHVVEQELERGELIGEPEVSELDGVEGRRKYAPKHSEEPSARRILQNRHRIDQIGDEEDGQRQRMHIRLYVIVGTYNERTQAQEPKDAEERSCLQQLLIGQVIARVDFENEHVVDTRAAPAVRVDAYAEHVKYDEKCATVEFDCDFPVEREFVAARFEYEHK